jgi:hypothetical protein
MKENREDGFHRRFRRPISIWKKNILKMATATTTWITTDSISHKHHDFDSRNDSYLKSNSIQPVPLTEERENIRKELYTETAEIKSSNPALNSVPLPAGNQLATTQNALLLHAIKEKYTLVTDHAVPSILHQDEILIEVSAIGLNPIDWKAPYVSISRSAQKIIETDKSNIVHLILASLVYPGFLVATLLAQSSKPPLCLLAFKPATSYSSPQQIIAIFAKLPFKNTR